MQISDIDNLAMLARLGIPDAEKTQFLSDFEAIVGYVDQIQSVNVPDDIKPHYMITNAMRADENPHESGKYTEDILAGAPDRDDNYFKVPKVL
ncbi:MAG: Asp-tRNA(Asn)/Glu-tRNA(Gln) amidotransferase subunit GatC [Candidatus Nomurabacteria bacterium]|nr:Asp-tRNA(Asn)/Glu-tRNA(Gln) amidotransferase subunit GatC [Candidatus Nomurabacteria bacterium]